MDQHPWEDDHRQEINVDYCIVGAGVSGLYSAVRLSEGSRSDLPPRICLLESTNRVGGRISTVKMPGSSFRADLGAMRFIPTQPLVASLIEDLGLQTYDYHFPTDFYAVRGRRLRVGEGGLENGASGGEVPYHSLRPEEKGKEPGLLIIHAIAMALKRLILVEPNADVDYGLVDVSYVMRRLSGSYDRVMSDGFHAFTPLEWRTIKLCARYPAAEGLSLYKIGFWDLVQGQLSSEAYSFVEEGLGYQTIIGTWNAADAIPWFLADFAKVGYKSVVGGMSRIIEGLEKRFLDQMARREDLRPFEKGLVVFNRTEVTRVSVVPSIASKSNEQILVDAKAKIRPGVSAELRLRANHCLVCLPKGAIERMNFFAGVSHESESEDLKKRGVISVSSPASISEARAGLQLLGRGVGAYEKPGRYDFNWLLSCVDRQPLLKMFLSFKKAWWTETVDGAARYDRKAQGFKVFTSLPLRQLYYHSSSSHSHAGSVSQDRDLAGEEAGSEGEGMIMAYCDAKHASYWDALALSGLRYGSHLVANEEERQVLADFGVSRHLAERAHEQIWRVHAGLIDFAALLGEDLEDSAFAPLSENGDIQKVPRSRTVLFRNWAKEPYFAGWHAWTIGVVSEDIKRIWERPWRPYPIYFAGEAVSSDQGWIEGAVRSSERVLMMQLGLPEPRWDLQPTALGSITGVSRRAAELGYDDVEDYVKW